MKNREIAEFLGTPTKTVETRLIRARAQLKEEMLTMMSTTFDEMRLQPGFTFRVVEALKRTRIQSPPSKATLPFSVSVAAGLLVLLFSLSIPYSPLYPIGQLVGSALPAKVQVPDAGVIPVDTIEITQIVSLSIADGEFGKKPTPEPNEKVVGAGEWEKKADMPTGRNWLAGTTINGKVYVVGGWSGGGKSLASVQEYNPITNSWIQKADRPTAATNLSTIALNGKIYAFGGWDLAAQKSSKAVEVYDPVADSWEKKNDMPMTRDNVSTAVVNGKIYLIGGSTDGNPIANAIVTEYNPQTDTWIQKADMPTPRLGLANNAPVIDGKIYIIGGQSEATANRNTAVATVEAYDPETDTWQKKADMPTARGALAISEIGGDIYVFGGSTRWNAGVLATVEKYAPKTDSWEKLADMPSQRASLVASAVDGKIYVIGGWEAGLVATVEAYDTGFEPTSVNPAGKLTTTWGEIKNTQ